MALEEVGIRLTLQQRRETAKGLQDTASDVRDIGTAAEDTGRRASRALGVLKGIGGAVATAAKVGVTALGTLATAGGAWGLRVAAANEQAQISFTTMLGSAQSAGSFIKDLQAFAAKTPFEFDGLQSSAASLISAGISADKVIPIMTSLGNATSGMGTGAEGIARATTALQQMNAAGKISAEDLNQLRDAGIPVYDLLTAATGKSTAAVAEMANKGKLGRKELDQLMAALESGKGLEKFAGLMDKQSASLTGMWSTVKDTLGQGMGKIVAPWVPAIKNALGGATAAATPLIDKLTAKSAEWAAKAPGYIATVRAAFSQLGAAVGTAWERIRGSFADAGGGSASLSSALGPLTSAVRVGGVVVGFLAGHLDLLAKALPYIAAGFVLWKAAQSAQTAATVVSIPLRVAELGVTLASASAQRALAFQLSLLTGVQSRSRLATLGGIAASVAQRVATLASAAASGVARGATLAWTGVQWALNAALSANPIALVVIGIAALVAGAVLAYQKVGWFRTAIDAMWGGIKTLAKWLWDVVVPFTPLGAAIKLVVGHFDDLKAAVGWVWDKLKGLWDLLQKGGSLLAGLFGGGGGKTESKTLPGRATGGPVAAGAAYVVGEHRPEVFVPQVDGTILPRIPTARRGDATDGALAGVGTSGPVHVHIEVDGREIGSAVINDLDDRVARR